METEHLSLTTKLIISGIFSVAMLALVWQLIRFNVKSRKVISFMGRVNNLCYEWSMNNLQEIINGNEQSAYVWFYSKMPQFDVLLTSERPLTLDEWFEKDDLKKLFDGL